MRSLISVIGLEAGLRMGAASDIEVALWAMWVVVGVCIVAGSALADVDSDSMIDPPAYVLSLVVVTWHLATHMPDYGTIYAVGLVGEAAVYAAYLVMPLSLLAAPAGAILGGRR